MSILTVYSFFHEAVIKAVIKSSPQFFLNSVKCLLAGPWTSETLTSSVCTTSQTLGVVLLHAMVRRWRSAASEPHATRSHLQLRRSRTTFAGRRDQVPPFLLRLPATESEWGCRDHTPSQALSLVGERRFGLCALHRIFHMLQSLMFVACRGWAGIRSSLFVGSLLLAPETLVILWTFTQISCHITDKLTVF